jgi:peptidoglycan/LPS O-acetylase OafA/YrhL
MAEEKSVDTPKTIEAWGFARERFTRLIIAAIALILLIAVFVLAMFFRPEYARDVLLVIGTTIGFVAGREYSLRQ